VKTYIDTSLVLAFYLDGNPLLDSVPKEFPVASSRLLWVEFARVLERAHRAAQLTPEEVVSIRRGFDETARTMNRLRLTEAILLRAEGNFPLVIKTLDALHLASAIAWLGDEDPANLSIWSLDRQFSLCAAAMGYKTPLLDKSGP
jgi:predicted nucleic acid-binding protein